VSATELDEPFAIYSRRAFDSYLLRARRGRRRRNLQQKIPRSRVVKTNDGLAAERCKRNNGTANCWWGADGANSAIANGLLVPLAPAEMEVAFGYRAPLAGQ